MRYGLTGRLCERAVLPYDGCSMLSISDLFAAASWWLTLFFLGVITFPVLFAVLRKTPTGMYVASRWIGLVLVGYIVWLGASLHLFPFTKASAVTVVALLALAEGVWLWRVPALLSSLREYVRTGWKQLLAEEAYALVPFAVFVFLRACKPELNSTEKFMDLGLVTSILRSPYMPPHDMWLSGYSINYYYFGHYLTALLARLSGVTAPVGYNLMMATLSGLASALTYGVLRSLLKGTGAWKEQAFAFLGSFWMVFGANWHPAVFGVILPLLKKLGWYHGSAGSYSFYWYPEATRYIGYNPPAPDKTIHEFPSYSFIVSDLHAHVLAVPGVLILTYLAWNLFRRLAHEPEKTDRKQLYGIAGFMAVLLAAAAMTNLWDIAVYLGLTLALLVVALLWSGAWKRILPLLIGFPLLAVALALPFLRSLDNVTGGIHTVSRTTPVYQLAVLWGFPVLVGLVYAIYLWRKSARDGITVADLFALILFLYAAILVVIPETVYVKDIYGSEYQRANTMFKLTYQAFILFVLASTYAIARMAAETVPRRRAAGVALAVCSISVLVYPFWTIKQYYSPYDVTTLDGLSFMTDDMRGAADFLHKVPGTPVIAEAPGNSYTLYNQLSMATGLPSVRGWGVHEWLWHGSQALTEFRASDLDRLYTSLSEAEKRSVVDRYNIRYVVVSPYERERYPRMDELALGRLGDIAYLSTTVLLIKVQP